VSVCVERRDRALELTTELANVRAHCITAMLSADLEHYLDRVPPRRVLALLDELEEEREAELSHLGKQVAVVIEASGDPDRILQALRTALDQHDQGGVR